MAGQHSFKDNFTVAFAAAPRVETGNNAMASAIFDMAGLESITFAIVTGTLADTDATFAVLVEHDDVVGFGTAAAAPDNCLDPLEADAGFTFALDDGVKTITYTPGRGDGKQFVRCTVTPSGNSGNAPLAMVAIKKPFSKGA